VKASTIKVLAVYWALLAFGMALYTTVRTEALDVLAPVWVGAIAGTVLGQLLALKRIRIWLVIWLVIATGLVWIPQLPDTMGQRAVWMAYIPAALCGFWCLGDRTSLVAFWFPAVLWMLTILDGTNASAMPDTGGLVLLGGLAVMFLVFLRVREERRIALWRTVSPSPLAPPAPVVTLHDGAGARLPRIVWAVVVSALGFAATMWLAPRLWQAETFDGGAVAVHMPDDFSNTQIGLPCCPRHATAPTTRARMKEYFDLGRGHEHVAEPVSETGCQVCNAEFDGGVIVGANESIYGYGGYGGYGYDHPQLPYNPPPVHDGYYGGGGGTYQAQGGGGGSYPSQVGGVPPSVAPPAQHTYAPPAEEYVPPQEARMQHVAPVVPTPQVRPVPPVPPPTVAQLPPPPPPPAPIVAPPEVPRQVPPPPQRKLPPPPTANTQRPAVAPGEAPQIRAPSHATSFVLQWAAILTASLLMIQIVALVLRPVRRAIALRHFAQPFWNETVAQRVSNAWQLALVGLRDAGWRTSSHESPAAFAKRVKVDGLERCATILERARHGIGIDRDDLADMTASAETAYRSARAQATPAARAVSWMRWPLV
jgi:hypothetical protein